MPKHPHLVELEKYLDGLHRNSDAPFGRTLVQHPDNSIWNIPAHRMSEARRQEPNLKVLAHGVGNTDKIRIRDSSGEQHDLSATVLQRALRKDPGLQVIDLNPQNGQPTHRYNKNSKRIEKL